MLLGQEGERVNVDAPGRDVGVVLVWLHQVEVGSQALGEPVVAVELELGRGDGVLAGIHEVALADLRASVGTGQEVLPRVGVLGRGVGVSSIGKVEPLLSEGLQRCSGIHHECRLHGPHQLLRWMVEVEFHLVTGVVRCLDSSVLQLGNKVLVADLGEAAALLCIEVDIINIQRCVWQGTNHEVEGSGGGNSNLVGSEEAVGCLSELNVDLDLVVLQGDQGKSQTGVVAEPELQRNVQGLAGDGLGSTSAGDGGEGGQIGGVSDHGGVSGSMPSGLGQLVPDVQPSGVVLVDALATDLELDALDQDVAEPVQPPELVGAAGWNGHGNTGNLHLEICAMDQITVS